MGNPARSCQLNFWREDGVNILNLFKRKPTILRPHAEIILFSLKEHPEEWVCGSKDSVTHLKSGFEVWLSLGARFCDSWPKSKLFNDVEKKAIYKVGNKIRNQGESRLVSKAQKEMLCVIENMEKR